MFDVLPAHQYSEARQSPGIDSINQNLAVALLHLVLAVLALSDWPLRFNGATAYNTTVSTKIKSHTQRVKGPDDGGSYQLT